MERMKIFIACVIGAGIGTAVALSVYQYLWWFGLIVGSLTGYLSYEFRAVVSAVKQAWCGIIGWKPNWELYKRNIKLLVFGFGCFTTIWIFSFLFIYSATIDTYGSYQNIPLPAIVIAAVGAAMMSALIFALITMTTITSHKNDIDRVIRVFKKMSPIYFHLYLLYCLFYKVLWEHKKNIWMSVKKIPSFVKNTVITTSRFIKTVFILIHSEIRLLCGVDAGIGVIAGYFAGHVIIGALAGGIIGLLNYEILSKRILHLIPKHT